MKSSLDSVRANACSIAMLHSRRVAYIYMNDVTGDIVITLTKRKKTWLEQHPVTLLEKVNVK